MVRTRVTPAPDHVGYEVTASNGEVGDFDVTITVKVAPRPTPPGGGAGTRL